MIQNFDNIEINTKEILRYAKASKTDVQTTNLMKECIDLLNPELDFKVCYNEFDISDEMKKSQDLMKCLKDCKKVIIFAATTGLYPDRLIAKYSRLSPAKAHMIDAIASERIESLCEHFCKFQNAKTNRFSPGYGDLPLEYQKRIFDLLECRKIGITLNDNLTMSPSKSVTAIFGV